MCHVEHKTLFCSAFLLLRGFSCLPSYPVTSRQHWQLTLDPHTAENHLWRANETAINEPIRTSISIYTQEFRGRVWANPGHPIIFLLFSTLFPPFTDPLHPSALHPQRGCSNFKQSTVCMGAMGFDCESSTGEESLGDRFVYAPDQANQNLGPIQTLLI